MKVLILLGAAALLGFAELHSAAPASPPIVPIHAPSPEAASGTLPTAARSAKSTHAPLVESVTSPIFRGATRARLIARATKSDMNGRRKTISTTQTTVAENPNRSSKDVARMPKSKGPMRRMKAMTTTTKGQMFMRNEASIHVAADPKLSQVKNLLCCLFVQQRTGSVSWFSPRIARHGGCASLPRS